MTGEVTCYKCNWCGKLHTYEVDADRCAFNHARKNYATSLLNDGHTLKTIKYLCGFNWNLTKEQEEITKDNCFIISHWQCCNKPAYKIVSINENGTLKLWGMGSWTGYYGETVDVNSLPKPYPKEELFIRE